MSSLTRVWPRRYLCVYDWAPYLLRLWVPLMLGVTITLVLLMEGRMLYGFVFQDDGARVGAEMGSTARS